MSSINDVSSSSTASASDTDPKLQEQRAVVLSFFRNVVANAYSYGLVSSSHASDVCSTLRDFGWSGSWIDPMAGTGFHALLFAKAGANVVASDAGTAGLETCWFPVKGGIDGAVGVADADESSVLWLSW